MAVELPVAFKWWRVNLNFRMKWQWYIHHIVRTASMSSLTVMIHLWCLKKFFFKFIYPKAVWNTEPTRFLYFSVLPVELRAACAGEQEGCVCALMVFKKCQNSVLPHMDLHFFLDFSLRIFRPIMMFHGFGFRCCKWFCHSHSITSVLYKNILQELNLFPPLPTIPLDSILKAVQERCEWVN